MATLTKEDGSIVSGANVYSTLQENEVYHEDNLNTVWTDENDDEKKEAALLRATVGLDSMYRERWVGFKSNHNSVTAPQFLAWPRKKDKTQSLANDFVLANMDKLVDFDGIEIDVDSIPTELHRAHMEVALVELTQPFVSTLLNRDNMVKYERVDVIETEFFRNSPAIAHFPHIDSLLASLASTAAVKLGAVIGLTEGEQDALKAQGAFDRWFNAHKV